MRLISSIFTFVILMATSYGDNAQARWLVFTSFRDGNAEIYLVDNNGENLQNLTNNPAEDTAPIWSPDGTTIVFISNRDEKFGLYQMDVDGENLQRLILSEFEIIAPSFSPDGTQIAYIALEGAAPRQTAHLMLMSSNGQDTISIAEDIFRVEWMPDSEHLLGLRYGVLLSIDLTDGTSTPIEGIFVGDFSISPDSTRIAYDYGGEFSSINVLDLDSGSSMMLPSISDVTNYDAVWSPDGTQLAYVTKHSEDRYNIYLITPDGSSEPRLLFDIENFNSLDPTWSPDSSQIAFRASESETEPNDIYVIDVDGANLLNLSNHPALDLDPAWQPLVP